MLHNLLRLSRDLVLLDNSRGDRAARSFHGGRPPRRVGREREGQDAGDSEDANNGRMQDKARLRWSAESLSLVLPSSGAGDKPAGMPPGPDRGPPEKLPELAFLQQNFDTRRAYLNSGSQQ